MSVANRFQGFRQGLRGIAGLGDRYSRLGETLRARAAREQDRTAEATKQMRESMRGVGDTALAIGDRITARDEAAKEREHELGMQTRDIDLQKELQRRRQTHETKENHKDRAQRERFNAEAEARYRREFAAEDARIRELEEKRRELQRDLEQSRQDAERTRQEDQQAHDFEMEFERHQNETARQNQLKQIEIELADLQKEREEKLIDYRAEAEYEAAVRTFTEAFNMPGLDGKVTLQEAERALQERFREMDREAALRTIEWIEKNAPWALDSIAVNPDGSLSLSRHQPRAEGGAAGEDSLYARVYDTAEARAYKEYAGQSDESSPITRKDGHDFYNRSVTPEEAELLIERFRTAATRELQGYGLSPEQIQSRVDGMVRDFEGSLNVQQDDGEDEEEKREKGPIGQAIDRRKAYSRQTYEMADTAEEELGGTVSDREGERAVQAQMPGGGRISREHRQAWKQFLSRAGEYQSEPVPLDTPGILPRAIPEDKLSGEHRQLIGNFRDAVGTLQGMDFSQLNEAERAAFYEDFKNLYTDKRMNPSEMQRFVEAVRRLQSKYQGGR